MDNFLLHVKSTIDYYGSSLATSLGVTKKVDLDDIVKTKELLSSDETAVVWEVSMMRDAPIDPLYDLVFSMGIKINNDPSNYNMMTLLSEVKALFPVGDTFVIRDYSTATPPTLQEGTFTVSNVKVDPQQFDRVSGIRLVSIMAKAVRDA